MTSVLKSCYDAERFLKRKQLMSFFDVLNKQFTNTETDHNNHTMQLIQLAEYAKVNGDVIVRLQSNAIRFLGNDRIKYKIDSRRYIISQENMVMLKLAHIDFLVE